MVVAVGFGALSPDDGRDDQDGSSDPELRLLCRGLRRLDDVAQLRSAAGRHLRTLHLHGNELTEVAGLETLCPRLENLVLSSNELTCLDGILALRQLQVLDVSCNRLRALPPLGSLVELRSLSAGYNEISALDPLVALWAPPGRAKLARLDLRDNTVAELGELAFLAGLHALRELRFQGPLGARACPVCRAPGYEVLVRRCAPALVEVDEVAIHGAVPALTEEPSHVPLPKVWPRGLAAAQAAPALSPSSTAGRQQAAPHGEGLRPDARRSRGGQAAAAAALVERARKLLAARCGGAGAGDGQGAAESKPAGFHPAELLSALSELRELQAERRRRQAESMVAPPPLPGGSDGATCAAGAVAQLHRELEVVASELRRMQAKEGKARRKLAELRREVEEEELRTCSNEAEAAAARVACASERSALCAAQREEASAKAEAKTAEDTVAVVLAEQRTERHEVQKLLEEVQARSSAVKALRLRHSAEVGEEREAAQEHEHLHRQVAEARLQSLQEEACIEASFERQRSIREEGRLLEGELSAVASARSEASVRHEVALQRLRDRASTETAQARAREASAVATLRRASAELASYRDEEASMRDEVAVLAGQRVLQEEAHAAEAGAIAENFGWRLAAAEVQAETLREQASEVEREIQLREQRNSVSARRAMEEGRGIELLELRVRRARLESSALFQELEKAELVERSEASSVARLRAAVVGAEADFEEVEHLRATEFVDGETFSTSRRELQEAEAEAEAIADELEVRGAELRHLSAMESQLEEESASVAARAEGLPAMEVRVRKAVEEIQTEAAAVAALQVEVKAIIEDDRTRHEAFALRSASQRRAAAEADRRLRATRDAVEEVEAHEADTLAALTILSQESDFRDFEIHAMREEAENLQAAWVAENRDGAMAVEQARAESVAVSEEADRQLSNQGLELAAKLRQQRATTSRLRRQVAEESDRCAAYEAEAEATTTAWRRERERLAEEVAAAADELRRL
eukprot:TRINITY_DN63263_c0_g1_i1.p1 TRINITY_DN63263_c0_g1~~TRINITY_DN63263_c0_g1_i1.p1  ORF type:complete len:993 (-),score=282.81 TRINITY_DN63263_c0_g1_i1:83-3061(-)